MTDLDPAQLLGQHERLRVNDVSLGLYHLPGANPAATDKPLLIMLHGARDVAASLLPTAQHLRAQFRCVLLELRGHGSSDHTSAYAMEHYLFDLYKVCESLSPKAPVILFGHSLGGQIVSRFAGLWPKRVQAAVVVEGLGPPAFTARNDSPYEVQRYAERLLQSYGLQDSHRPLPSIEFAAVRLCHNNPRLDPTWAEQLAKLATRTNEHGQLIWAFDPRVQQVFASLNEAQGATYWRQASAPVLVLAGSLAHEYWRTGIAHNEGWTGEFAPGEYEQRAAIFPNSTYKLITHAGHMVHYDQPDRLGQLSLEFLEQYT